MKRAKGGWGVGVVGTFAVTLSMTGGCASDGAVRLARCFETRARELEASAETALEASCDLGAGVSMGAYVVAFPDGAISARQLAAAGLPREQINAVSQLQMGDSPTERINVLPGNRSPRPSRTTLHRRFVRTPELLACRLESSRVGFKLKKAGRSIEVTGLNPE